MRNIITTMAIAASIATPAIADQDRKDLAVLKIVLSCDLAADPGDCEAKAMSLAPVLSCTYIQDAQRRLDCFDSQSVAALNAKVDENG